jgi:enterochelin esterase-like enzyme
MSIRPIVVSICALIGGATGAHVAATAQSAPPAAAQEAIPGRPASSTVRGQEYPRILPDRRVIFRARAPEAKTVAVRARGNDSGMGAEPYPMKPIGEGMWETTIGPVRSGFHYYELLVDGHAMNDPASQTYFGWARPTSGLEVPDDTLTFYVPKDIPHGEVRIRPYFSKVTGQHRNAYVYTPPGYDRTPSQRYPVLYLQHGSGENETSWTWQGRVNVIMDTLLAEGKTVPMLIVMDQGYATRAGAAPVQSGQRGGGAGQADAFQDVVLRDLIPAIDASYRTLTDRRHRAIAGLSMGAGQAVRIGFGNPDVFASVGAFSGGGGGGRGGAPFDRQTAYNGVMADVAAFNNKFDLFWIGYGNLEGGYGNGKKLHETLQAAGIKHVWFETVGSHEWQVWRKSLYDFAPRLFRTGAVKTQ